MTRARKKQEQAGKPKLVILPDACLLLDVCADIPEEFFVDSERADSWRPKKWVDSFEFLPKTTVKGIKIIEYILAESTGFDGRGRQFSSTLSKPKDKRTWKDERWIETSSFLKTHLESYVRSFQRGVNGDFISIVATPESSKFLDVCTKMCGGIVAYIDYISGLTDAEERKKCLIALESLETSYRTARSKASKNRGEKILFDYIKSHDEPILFVSSDNNALLIATEVAKDAETKQPIIKSNLLGYFQALKDAGILEKMGIKPHITPLHIVSSIRKYKAPTHLDDKIKIDYIDEQVNPHYKGSATTSLGFFRNGS